LRNSCAAQYSKEFSEWFVGRVHDEPCCHRRGEDKRKKRRLVAGRGAALLVPKFYPTTLADDEPGFVPDFDDLQPDTLDVQRVSFDAANHDETTEIGRESDGL